MKKYIAGLLSALLVTSATAIDITLPPGVQGCWDYHKVVVSSMDAKPVVETNGTFSWEMLGQFTLVDTNATRFTFTPQPEAFMALIRVNNAELVAAGTLEGIDWSKAYGVYQLAVIQRAMVTKVADLLGVTEPTKTAWITAVLSELRE